MLNPSWRRSLPCILALLAAWSSLPPPAHAQLNLVQRIRALFEEEQTIGQARGRRRGAAVRDSDLCAAEGRSRLTALAPNTNAPIKTSASHPTFWFYVPYPLTNRGPEPITLKFVLKDEQDTVRYETTFTPPAAAPAGIVSLRLTGESATLQENRTYRWYFLVYCNDPQHLYEPTFIDGLIRREPLERDRQQALAQATPNERFLLYAQERLWYDTLTALAEARRADPTNAQLQSAWEDVLQGVNLDEFREEPIVARYYVLSQGDRPLEAAPTR